MKAKELMIGDWVLDGDVYTQVTSITCDGNIETTRNEHSNIELVEPISLTPEILEKNGFEDIGDDTWQLTERPCWFWVDFLNRCYGCDFDTSTYEYEDIERRLHLRGVPSVHELQHSLKLCGIEK